MSRDLNARFQNIPQGGRSVPVPARGNSVLAPLPRGYQPGVNIPTNMKMAPEQTAQQTSETGALFAHFAEGEAMARVSDIGGSGDLRNFDHRNAGRKRGDDPDHDAGEMTGIECESDGDGRV